MDKFLTYLENTDFVRWVYAPSKRNTRYWEEFQKNNPEEIELIREARIILLQLKSKQEFSVSRIESALPEILKKINKKKQIQKAKHFALTGFRYAAIAILFFGIGLFFMQGKYRSALDDMSRQFANISYYNGEVCRLVLADGKNIIINEKLSQVHYSPKGTIIIDQKDTIPQNIDSDNLMNQLIVPYGKNSSITLADGTVAFLNAGSRLIFPPVFEGKTREVFLAGEGYFDVAHNPEVPFIVKTTDLNVTAVGTSFNVAAYPTESKIEVVLAEGRVNINKNEFTIFQSITDMAPNDMICFNKTTNEMDLKKVITENYTSWHLGYINFESVELHKIITKLERYYDVNIFIENSEIAQKKITGKLKLKDDIDEMLRVLSVTSTLKIKKINQHEYLLN
ncbi:FecR family protein [Mangrovibacterium lignilyticum]|uniref:FecR family protein n=1 Tax=Mangrovibacterium lignilyticum TaxID=2668052 RepID=UPI0013D74E96|nr:FecR family protein [Mangrovibacterium lignilyticum]